MHNPLRVGNTIGVISDPYLERHLLLKGIIMAALTWDASGEHYYETGVDHGVLYIPIGGVYSTGVAWNGLTAVTESPSGAEATAQYADNIKYLNLVSAEEFGATIEAYTYPDEFAECNGEAELAQGVNVGQQARSTFGLSYRTKVGNDTDGQDHAYKLHLVYGATAAPSEKAYSSVNDSPEAIAFSWEISTVPVSVAGMSPTASITIDSRTADQTRLEALEKILYGAEEAEPRLPLPDEVKTLMTAAIDPTVHVTGVTVEPDSLSLTEGDRQQITVTVNPSNATDKTYTISSSDTSRVTVDGTTITGVAPTTTPVTVTVRTSDGGFTDAVSVTVTARPPVGGDTTNVVGKAIVGKAVL